MILFCLFPFKIHGFLGVFMQILIPLVSIAALVGIDQLFKYWVLESLAPIGVYPVIEGIFQFRYLENQGMAFGMMQEQWWLLIGGTAIVLAAGIAVIVLRKIHSKWLLAAVTLAVAGGLGNLIDRIFRGFVVDYLDICAINFAVFNFADVCVSAAMVMFIIWLLFFHTGDENKHRAGKAK